MRDTLVRASVRYLVRHPWQAGLAILGIALGVAVVVAVDLANQSAGRAFELSHQALAGQTTHQVLGGPQGIPEAYYTDLRRAGLRDAAPVVTGWVRSATGDERPLRVMGVDPFAEAGVRPALGALTGAADLARLLTEPQRAYLRAEDRRALGVDPEEPLPVHYAGRAHELTLLGDLPETDPLTAAGLADVLVMDIGAAQALLERGGRLDRIDLVVPEGAAGERRLERLRETLPAGAQLVRADERYAALREMSRAFELNLTAFSLLALVVGFFLIYNTMTFAVVQRRRLIGLLRAIGVTRRQVFTQILGEAALLGLLGTLLGLGLGVALSHVLLELVTRTINDLYFVLAVRELTLSPLTLAQGAVLGIGASLLAAVVPAREATRAPPRAVLSRAVEEARSRRLIPLLAAGGLGLCAIGGLILKMEGGLWHAFAGLFFLIVGAALLAPGVGMLLLRLLAPLAGWLGGGLGRVAVRSIAASPSRNGVAAAALMVAVAAVIGVGVMVDSFRHTFTIWLDGTLRADVYVSVPRVTGETAPAIDPEVAARLKAVEGAAAVTTSRTVRVPANGERWRLRVWETRPFTEGALRFKEAAPEAAWAAFQTGQVLVTEPFAAHQEVRRGDRLTLDTPDGSQAFQVAAILYDYATSEGAVVMERQTYDRHFDDPAVDSLGFHAADGVAAETLLARLREAAVTEQILEFTAREEVRAASLAVFDRTFTVTQVLRLLALLVAVVGVLSVLLALALERAREHATLRALGVGRRQLGGVVLAQTGALGLVAGLLAIPLGLTLAAVLTLIINQRAFGWSLDLSVTPMAPMEALVIAVGAALAAGLYPAWRVARAEPADALREE